jgi:hypothetical protein
VARCRQKAKSITQSDLCLCSALGFTIIVVIVVGIGYGHQLDIANAWELYNY